MLSDIRLQAGRSSAGRADGTQVQARFAHLWVDFVNLLEELCVARHAGCWLPWSPAAVQILAAFKQARLPVVPAPLRRTRLCTVPRGG